MGVVAEVVTCLYRVIAQEVHGFTHFGNGVGEGLAGLADEQAHQRLDLGLHQVGGALQNGSTLGWRGGLPDRCGVQCALDGVVHVGNGGLLHMADDVAVVSRVQHRCGSALAGGAGQ